MENAEKLSVAPTDLEFVCWSGYNAW
jgi:hypothetical protein